MLESSTSHIAVMQNAKLIELKAVLAKKVPNTVAQQVRVIQLALAMRPSLVTGIYKLNSFPLVFFFRRGLSNVSSLMIALFARGRGQSAN
jgi:hypothetical protein